MALFLESSPLTRKLWMFLNRRFAKAMTENTFSTYLATNPDIFELYVNIVMGDTNHKSLNNLEQIISFIRRFRVGEKKSFPTICVYVPYLQVHQGFADLINTLDKYNPTIDLFLMIRETDIPDNRKLLQETAIISHILFERVINFRYLLLLERDVDMLGQMIEAVSTFTLQQRENRMDLPTYPPIFEISPRIRVDDQGSLVRSLLTLHVEYPEVFEFVTMGPCGFSSFFFRAKETYILGRQVDLGSLPTPLFPCGANKMVGSQESSHSNSLNGGRNSQCFYKLITSSTMKDKSVRKCRRCRLVQYCMGCLVDTTENSGCYLLPFFNTLLTELKRQPSLIAQLEAPKPKTGILELDWNYIYDSFK